VTITLSGVAGPGTALNVITSGSKQHTTNLVYVDGPIKKLPKKYTIKTKICTDTRNNLHNS